MKYLIRLIVSPFVLGILFITHVIYCIIRLIDFIKFGGEFNNYKKDEKVTMRKIYDKLEEKWKEEQM